MNTDIPYAEDDTEYVLPGAEALLAATLALMTGHAQSNCARQRGLMAQKIRSHLLQLSRHAGLTPGFRSVVHRVAGHWDALPTADAAASDPGDTPRQAEVQPEHRRWHTAARHLH